MKAEGTFTIIDSTLVTPFVGYDASVAINATSGPNGEDPGGRVNAALTKRGEDQQSFQVALDCMEILDDNSPTWEGWSVLVGGTVLRDNEDGYRWAVFTIFDNVQGSGNDYANFLAYTNLLPTAANACENARQSPNFDASIGFQVKGEFTVTND